MSPHLVPSLLRLAVSDRAVIHWKNITMTIPRTIDKVSKNRTNGYIGRQTVENRADEFPGEN